MWHDMTNFLIILTVLSLFILTNSVQFKLSNKKICQQREILDNEISMRNPETFMDIVKEVGYDAEEHEVKTEDGFILTVHRILSGPKSSPASGKPIVILLHGLLAASDVWVSRRDCQDLAYLLVNNGYDVWALNFRGNFYSKQHEKIPTSDSKFWRFSWHEFGVYDTAATVDYALSVTGESRVSLVGHSMGGTVILVFLSSRPEYNSKVNVALTLAPVAIVNHTFPGLFSSIGLRYGNQIQEALKLLNIHEIFPRYSFNTFAEYIKCQKRNLFCSQLGFILFGVTNLGVLEPAMMPRLLNHYPQGTSVETLAHYRQILHSGRFAQYDFGPIGNFMKYRNVLPPEYPLERISAPVVFYYGDGDPFATRSDIEITMKKLQTATMREISYSKFGHIDFVFRKEVKNLVYDDILEILDVYRNDSKEIINVVHVK
ncbi:lipase 3-like [Aphidius gifuensis]|uniref:lipase 3-like n=1 Tax=Aphidius gifuensis TaxID=684658 RepID=UPI001CDD80C5|nr:lipase 3-like [Aphidius gifuensis]